MNTEQKEPLPELTHLQFVILEALGSREKRGKQLREDLAAHGVKKSGPAFYQLMSRLEEANFVKGWYEQEIIEGQIIKQRHYELLGNGIRAVNELKKFYHNKFTSSEYEPVF